MLIKYHKKGEITLRLKPIKSLKFCYTKSVEEVFYSRKNPTYLYINTFNSK